MKKYLLIMLISIAGCVTAIAAEPDMIVTQDGESLKVYNLDISTGDKIYYTLEESEDAPVLKINKSDVLVLKKADGTVLNLNQITETPTVKVQESANSKNPAAHAPVTYTAIEDSFLEEDVDWKKELKQYLFYRYYKNHGGKEAVTHEKFILAGNGDDQVLNFRVLSEKDKTLAVARARKVPELDKKGNKKTDKKGNVKLTDGKYEKSEITIPEYVMINGDKYSVTEIDPAVFVGHTHIKNMVFPATLKLIDAGACWGCNLKDVILPESMEIVGPGAFCYAGSDVFGQLYIPKGVKEIGASAFHMLGKNTSYRGFYQGNLTSIPDFISVGNCKDFGIDEEAVEAYERRK